MIACWCLLAAVIAGWNWAQSSPDGTWLGFWVLSDGSGIVSNEAVTAAQVDAGARSGAVIYTSTLRPLLWFSAVQVERLEVRCEGAVSRDMRSELLSGLAEHNCISDQLATMFLEQGVGIRYRVRAWVVVDALVGAVFVISVVVLLQQWVRLASAHSPA